MWPLVTVAPYFKSLISDTFQKLDCRKGKFLSLITDYVVLKATQKAKFMT